MGVYSNRIQAPTKTLTSEWIPDDGELFRDEVGNLYMGDNVTASDALTPINGGGGGALGSFSGIPYAYSSNTSASGIATGTFRLDNVAFGSATKLYIHDTDGLNYNQDGYWDLFTSGTITLHRSSPEGYVMFNVTRMVDQGTYHEFDVTRVGGATGFTNADEIRMAVTMDAPGVRRLVVDMRPAASAFTPLVNSLIGDPSASFSPSQCVVTLTDGFGTGSAINGYGALSSQDNSGEWVQVSVSKEDQDTVHIHWPPQTNEPSAGIVTIIVG